MPADLELDKTPSSLHVTLKILKVFLFLIFSILLSVLDTGVDIKVAVSYFLSGDYYYFSWMVVFLVISTIIITSVSIRMYLDDMMIQDNSSGDNVKPAITRTFAITRIVLCILGSIIQIAPIIRCVDSFRYALRSLRAESNGDEETQKKYYSKMLNEDSDVALLKVFECYSESALQLVLQITLLLMEYKSGSTAYLEEQLLKIALSFLVVGVSMANYNRSIRIDQSEKNNISILGLIVLFFWHFSFTVSRVLIIVALAFMSVKWACVVLLGHWLGMTIWIAASHQNDFCSNNLVCKSLFPSAVGIVYIFNFVTLKEEPTKKSYSVFYAICFLEYVIIVTFWAVKSVLHTRNWVYYFFIVVPSCTFLLTLVCIVIYYKCLHPNKSNKLKYFQPISF